MSKLYPPILNFNQLALEHTQTCVKLLGDLINASHPSPADVAQQAAVCGLPVGILSNNLRRYCTSGLSAFVPTWDWNRLQSEELDIVVARYIPLAKIGLGGNIASQVQSLKRELNISKNAAQAILQRYKAFGAFGLRPLNVEKAAVEEITRRVRLLGPLCELKEYEAMTINQRAREVLVTCSSIRSWWLGYQKSGAEGIKPAWKTLSYHAECMILIRSAELGELLTKETVSDADIEMLAIQNQWTASKTKMWVKRGRSGGMLALAPTENPYSTSARKKTKNTSFPALATLTEKQIQQAEERFVLIADLVQKDKSSDKEVRERAVASGKSRSQLWDYIRRWREAGLAGLADRQRSDTGQTNVSARMENIVKALYLVNFGITLEKVREEAEKRARFLGEPPPSYDQVRRIVEQIPKAVVAFAQGGEVKKEYMGKFKLTFPINYDELGFVLQIDHTEAPNVVMDRRDVSFRDKSGEVRPYIIHAYEPVNGLIAASRITYDRPNRFDIATVIRDAVLFAGKPDEIWVDNGWELVADLIKILAQEIGCKHYPGRKRNPRTRGGVESSFKIALTKFFSGRSDFVGFDPVQRNPNIKALYDIYEFEAQYAEFVNDFNMMPHSKTKQPRLEYWRENVFSEPVDPEHLDILLLERQLRTVHKDGVRILNRKYQSPTGAFADLITKKVLVYSEASYLNPDSIIVYHNGKRIEAFATDTSIIRELTPHEKYRLQAQQEKNLQEFIDTAKEELESVDRNVPVVEAPVTDSPKTQIRTRGNTRHKPKPETPEVSERNKAFEYLKKGKPK
jgi:hypothetical protein